MFSKDSKIAKKIAILAVLLCGGSLNLALAGEPEPRYGGYGSGGLNGVKSVNGGYVSDYILPSHVQGYEYFFFACFSSWQCLVKAQGTSMSTDLRLPGGDGRLSGLVAVFVFNSSQWHLKKKYAFIRGARCSDDPRYGSKSAYGTNCVNGIRSVNGAWVSDYTIPTHTDGHDTYYFACDSISGCSIDKRGTSMQANLSLGGSNRYSCGERAKFVFNYLRSRWHFVSSYTDRSCVKSFALIGDPQYPWLNSCGASSRDEERDSQKSISATFNSVNSYNLISPLLAVLIMGDLTAYGHGWQVEQMEEYLDILTPPVYFNLGNHDYINNWNDCHENNCVLNSLELLRNGKYNKNLDSFDLYKSSFYESPTNRNEYYGSLAWSKTVGDIHVVFLGSSPIYENTASSYHGGTATTNIIKIRTAMEWLDKDLARARSEGKIIIVMWHEPNENLNGDGGGYPVDSQTTPAIFNAVLKKYGVSAVFHGHVHGNGYYMGRRHGGVPSFIAAGATCKSYFVLDIDPRIDKGLVYRVKAGGATNYGDLFDSREFVAEFPLIKNVQDLDPTIERPYEVRFINNGAFIAKFYLRYIDADGDIFSDSTGDKHNGQGWVVTIPAGATSVNAWGHVKTGLLWNLFPKVFDEYVDGYSCFKLWGSTFSRKGGRC